MKRVLSNILFGIVICVFGYLSIANILHVIYLKKYDTFDFDNIVMTKIKENISKLESNIDKISRLDNSVFTEEELSKIKDTFDNDLQSIKENKLLTYKGIQRFYLRDFLEVDLGAQLPLAGGINILEILSKHNDSISDILQLYRYDFVRTAYGNEETFLKVKEAYKYNTLDPYNAILYEAEGIGINARIFYLGYCIEKEKFIANLVLRIGGGEFE